MRKEKITSLLLKVLSSAIDIHACGFFDLYGVSNKRKKFEYMKKFVQFSILDES